MKATNLVSPTINNRISTKAHRTDTETSSPRKEQDRERHLVELLKESDVFKEFASSFSSVTGLPLALRPATFWNLPLHDQRNEGPFCKAVAESRHGCAACLQMQEDLATASRDQAAGRECPFGLIDSAVPVKVEGKTVAYLQTGQVAIKPVKKANLERAGSILAKKGINIDVSNLEDVYLQTRYVEPEKFQSMINLLKFMADHLSSISNQLAIRQNNAEPVFIARARTYIEENITEELPLSRVAQAVHTSSFYFCKMFKKVTGLNFTHYVSRVRVEKAKTLLQNPNLRISEIAFDVGFQSLTHFNRVFRNITGASPTEFRRTEV
jgi:AraC-like DNA-binding protein